MSLGLIESRHCARCNAVTRQEVVRKRMASGAEHLAIWCLGCDHMTPSKNGQLWIDKDTVKRALKLDDLSILRLVDDGALSAPRCTHCNRRGGEVHHWAPQALFADADKWPTDYLCKACHDLWHDTVTPQLRKGVAA